jgi:hypothetical protein
MAKKMSERQIVARVDAQLRRCNGFDGDKVEADRKSALDYYFQRLRGDEVQGASKVVSGDLSAMVEANLAQMMDAFSGDAIAEFHAMDEADADQCELESCVVQYFLMGLNNGFLQFLQAIKDALLLRNGVMKIWIEEKTRATRRTLIGVTDEALPPLIDAPGVEVGAYNPKEGTLRIRIVDRKLTFKAEALPLENFLYLDSWDSCSVQDIPFCAERHVESRSDMIEQQGFAKEDVERLPRWNQSHKLASQARSPGSIQDYREGIDKSGELVEWYECYVLMDTDGDGIAERRRICISGNTLLADEPASLVPYAAGSAIINPHRFLGISLYDKLRQVQDVSTGLQRGLLDNVTATNKPRVGYLDGIVNVDDLDNGRPNASVRVKKSIGDVNRAVAPIIVPDMSQGILANLEHQRSLRSEMGGAALDLATGSMQLNERMGSQGLDRAYSVMEQLAALMTKTVAATLIREAFLLSHATLRENYDQPVPFKRTGRWQTAIPSQWPKREHLTVKVGMSPGERQRRAGALERVGQFQQQMAAQGMDEVLVDLDRFYRLALDWCRAQDIPHPEQYFVDPRSEQSTTARKAKSEAGARDKAAQSAFLQQAVQLEQIRTALGKYQTDVETQFKYWAETLRAEIEEAKIVGNAATTLLQGAQKPRDVTPKGKANGKAPGSKAITKQ